jgi:hypothetical protein
MHLPEFAKFVIQYPSAKAIIHDQSVLSVLWALQQHVWGTCGPTLQAAKLMYRNLVTDNATHARLTRHSCN